MKLKKQLKSIFKRHNIVINIVFSSFKIRSYFSLKDKESCLLRSSLVYKFNCMDDHSITYIGKTKRHLFIRSQEHYKQNSQIHNHLKSCNSCKSSNLFNNFSVLFKSNKDFDLQIAEALFIKEKRPYLNKQLSGEGASFLLNIF